MKLRHTSCVLYALFLLMPFILPAQPKNVAGNYFMRGVMETASVFQLNPDSSFEFFFSQGAVDRTGKGKWQLQGDSIVFSSAQRPPKDFALVNSKTVSGNFVVVKIEEQNTMLLPYTDVALQTMSGILREKTDSHGEVRFPKKDFSAISLLFRLCPDRYSVFNPTNKTHNYFTFRLERWIAEVFFESFSLHLSGGVLNGRHPLLQGETFRYEKGE